MNVLITGISRGLGKALAQKFLLEGHRVIGIIRSQEQKAEIEEFFQKKIDLVIGDLGHDEVYDNLKEKLKSYKKIDLLINNAGVAGKGTTINSQDPAHLKSMFDVNCLAPMRVTQNCMDHLLNSDSPRVVNISSRFGSITKVATGELSKSTSYSYRISKAALNMFTACLIQEFSETKVKVLSIHPGSVNTGMIQHENGISAEEAAINIFNLVHDYNAIKSGIFV